MEKEGEEPYTTYEPCIIGKMARSLFDGRVKRVAEVLELVYTDICGLFNEMELGEFLYIITFTDDYSQYGYVYLIKYKHESFEKFKELKAQIEK